MRQGDTSPDVAAISRARIRELSPSQRVAEGAALCRDAREVMAAGIRSRHPDYSAAQVDAALQRLMWGDELFRRARPDQPLLAP